MAKKSKNKKSKKTVGVDKLKIQKREPRKRVESDEWYVATFEAAGVKHNERYDNDYLEVKFALGKCEAESGDALKDFKIQGRFSLPITPGKIAYEIITGIVGRDLDVDEDVNLKAYYGEKFKIFIEDSDKDDDDGQAWQRITKVKAAKKSKKKKSKKKSKK